jgi:hypothetical protein
MGRGVELTRPGRHHVSLRCGCCRASPVAAKILDDPSGTVEGNAALRNYVKRGLEVYPNLYFELLDVMHGLFSIVFSCSSSGYFASWHGQNCTSYAKFSRLGSQNAITCVLASRRASARKCSQGLSVSHSRRTSVIWLSFSYTVRSESRSISRGP